MVNPQTISEKMLYNTVRLVATNESTGTGFFFHFNVDNTNVPVIFTNKHVVNNNQKESVKFLLHLKNGDLPSEEKIEINLITEWYFHPKQDLCFCFLAPLLQQIKTQQGKDIFYIPITEDLITDNNKLKELSAIEDVIMVGYPTGLWDQKNNYPLFRRGITASHPNTDFNEENIGIVDMACFPGSSGSPIFILNENGYSDKKGNTYMGASRLLFLGILFAGPQLNSKGELIVENIPTQQKISSMTPIMINLGYYIKSQDILIFKEDIKKRINSGI